MADEPNMTADSAIKGSSMKAENFLPEDYRPAEDEPFMNERQLEYFRRKLIAWKNDILEESRDTITGMKEGVSLFLKSRVNISMGTFAFLAI